MHRLKQLVSDNAAFAFGSLGACVLLLALSGWLLATTADIRYRRDIHRIGFNQNWQLLEELVKATGGSTDSLEKALATGSEATADKPYLVVSIADRRLWYKQRDQILFTTQVAVGSGKTMEKVGGREEYKFDTPRGRLVVESKETDPVWVPPDWHYEEMAKKKGLGLIHLERGKGIPSPDGASIVVDGNDIVKLYPDGRKEVLDAAEGHEITAGGNIVIPPYGTNQRKYKDVLGTHRLYMGDGYGLHGTNEPNSIGRAASHGCVRLRNEDIAYLYNIVPVGTPVYIY